MLVAGLAVNIVAVALDDGVLQILLLVAGIAMLLASVFLLVRSRDR